MKRKTLLTIWIGIAFLFISACNPFTNQNGDSSGNAKQVQNEETLKNVLARSNQRFTTYSEKGGFNFTATDAAVSSNNVSAPQTENHSETNTQVEGVDEGDIVKVDGKYIYKLQTNGVIILEVVEGGLLEVVSKITYTNYVPQELFVYDNYLITIGGTYESRPYMDSSMFNRADYYFNYYSKVEVYAYDMSDLTNLVELDHITITGNYLTSRRIEDTFYFMSSYSSYRYQYDYMIEPVPATGVGESSNAYNPNGDKIDQTNSSTPIENPLNLPLISIDGEEEHSVDLRDIYYYEESIGYTYFTMIKVDLSQEDEVNVKSYLSNFSGTIYVSENYIYTSLYSYEYDLQPVVGIVDYRYYTDVQRYSLDTLLNDVSYRIEGYLKDRYSLDEYQGYLRVAVVYHRDSHSYSGVYIFDGEGKQVGKVDNLAEGETIYSVDFDKNFVYLVTFRQVDPFYIIDLTDVNNPIVKTELKKEGVSLYLHAFKDGIHTLGIGYNTSEGRTTGLEVTYFSVENKEQAKIIDQYVTTDSSVYAEVMYNPKALLFMEEEKLFGFAATQYHYSSIYENSYEEQGFLVFKINENDELELTVLSNVERFNYSQYYEKQDSVYNDYYKRYLSLITRGVVIGDYLYTISDQIIGIYQLGDLSLVSKVDLSTSE